MTSKSNRTYQAYMDDTLIADCESMTELYAMVREQMHEMNMDTIGKPHMTIGIYHDGNTDDCIRTLRITERSVRRL